MIKVTPPAGLEPAIFGLEVQRVIQLRQEGLRAQSPLQKGGSQACSRKLAACTADLG